MPAAPSSPTAIHQPAWTTSLEDGYRQLVRRAQSEYLEMPGLCLTFDQAIKHVACGHSMTGPVAESLQDLIAEGFVAVSARGIYVRRTTA